MNVEPDNSHEEQASKTPSERPTAKRISRLAICCGAFALLTWLAIAFYKYCARSWGVFFAGEIAAETFNLLTLLAAAVAIVSEWFRKEKIVFARSSRGYFSYIIIMVSMVSVFAAITVLPLDLRRQKRFHDLWMCRKKIERLRAEIREYAAGHNGYLPIADKWCDSLVEHSESLSRDDFYCPVSKGACSYAFNKNLSGIKLSDVSRWTVLLYESHEGWNLAGGAELLNMSHKGIGLSGNASCNVLYVDGYYWYSGDLDRLKWDIKVAEEPSTK
jgi:hypothetical protein